MMRTILRVALLSVLVLILPAVDMSRADVAGSQPNIVLLLVDDLGWADPGFHGGNADLTPYMDRLAAQSVRCTQFYMHAVFAPARAALMTGRYPFRTWMDWQSEDFGKPSYLEMLDLSLARNKDAKQHHLSILTLEQNCEMCRFSRLAIASRFQQTLDLIFWQSRVNGCSAVIRFRGGSFDSLQSSPLNFPPRFAAPVSQALSTGMSA